MAGTDAVAGRAALEREIRDWRDQLEAFSQDLERRRMVVAELIELVGELDRLPEEESR